MDEKIPRLVLAAMKVVYDKTMTPQLLQMLSSGEPAQSLAQAVISVVSGLKQQAKGIDPNEVNRLVPAVMKMLTELAEAANLFKADRNVLKQAMDLVAQQMGGKAAPAQPAAQPAAQPQGLIGAQMAEA